MITSLFLSLAEVVVVVVVVVRLCHACSMYIAEDLHLATQQDVHAVAALVRARQSLPRLEEEGLCLVHR